MNNTASNHEEIVLFSSWNQSTSMWKLSTNSNQSDKIVKNPDGKTTFSITKKGPWRSKSPTWNWQIGYSVVSQLLKYKWKDARYADRHKTTDWLKYRIRFATLGLLDFATSLLRITTGCFLSAKYIKKEKTKKLTKSLNYTSFLSSSQ